MSVLSVGHLAVLAAPAIEIPGLTPKESAGFVNYLITQGKISPRRVQQRIEACLNFLRLCVAEPGKRHVPTRQVDKIWHGMILHTLWYPRLCAALGKDVIHHIPNDWKVVGDCEPCDDDVRGGGCNTPASYNSQRGDLSECDDDGCSGI